VVSTLLRYKRVIYYLMMPFKLLETHNCKCVWSRKDTC